MANQNETMTIQSIQAVVEKIRLEVDHEEKHKAEDALRENFIKFVAAHGSEELQSMAKEVLKTNEIKFYRWYA